MLHCGGRFGNHSLGCTIQVRGLILSKSLRGKEPISWSQSKKGDGRLSQFSTSHAGGHWFKSSSAHQRILPLLNPRKISRFSQPLLSQLHSLFQRESWLITQLTRGFLNAEMGLASQISNGFTGDFRRPPTKL